MRITVRLVLLLSCVLVAGSVVFAQESKPTFSDPDWGERQHIEEALKYWAHWELSETKGTLSEIRRKGYDELKAMTRPKNMFKTQAVTPSWFQVGGSQDGHVSGRPNSIAFSHQRPQTCYLGTSGGGVWKSTDLGTTWVNVSRDIATNAIGAVAVDPTNDSIVYAATGDLYSGNTGEMSVGDGLYKSVDGGLNWSHIATKAVTGSTAYQMIFDPANSSTLFLTGGDGVRRSIDGGATWKKVLAVNGTTSIVIDPNNGKNIFIGGAGAIKRSNDGGDSWSGNIASTVTGGGTITLALSAKNGFHLYAGIANDGSSAKGVANSEDSGVTWTLKWNNNYTSQQAFYDNACAANPNASNVVVVGGLDIWRSTNSASSFTQTTDWRVSSSDSRFAHADVHVLQYGSNNLWALTDGGVFMSGDNGGSWQSRNRTLPTMLFVGGDADADFTYVLGGAQDNGINRASVNDPNKQFKSVLGGDGGRCFISQTDGLYAYSTYIGASLQKSPNRGETWNFGTRGDNNIIPTGSKLLNEGVPFYMYYDVSESNPAIVAIAGGTNVYYSNDGVATLDAITKSNTITGGPETVHVPAADENVVYAGNSTTMYVTKDLGGSWTKSSQTLGLVSDIVTDPNDASKVWVSIAGAGSKHFAYSTDYGATWTFPATNFPSVNAQTIARAPNGALYIGHTFGVLRSLDFGTTWEPMTDGMPLAQVTKLRVRGKSTTYLLATTYGNGMYAMNLNDPPQVPSGVGGSDVSAFKWISVFPNPSKPGAAMTGTFSTDISGTITIKLYDELGREIKTLLNDFLEKGEHTVTLAMPSLAGSYWAVLTENGRSISQHLITSTVN